MSDTTTKTFLAAYVQATEAPMFLSSFFKVRPGNIHNTEEVEFDIQRDGEDVAVAIQDLSVEPRQNQNNVYTSKSIKPPIFSEAGPVNNFTLIKRRAGQNPFQDPKFQANAMDEAKDLGFKLQNKIRRSIELMASQVLTTGAISLLDNNGNVNYSVSFAPKAAHFQTVGTSWATVGSADPLLNLRTLAGNIRNNGKTKVKMGIFGEGALANLLKNTDVRAVLDNRGLAERASITGPQGRDEMATFHGSIATGDYTIELWTYSAKYEHPQTNALTPYVPDDKVILLGDGRLDLTFGGIPMVVPPDQRVLPFLPERVTDGGRQVDIHLNAWVTQNNRTLMIEAAARPMTIPTAIDTFGCLDTIP